MRSKTIALFLALGMAASVTACASNEPAEVEGGEGTPEIEQTTQKLHLEQKVEKVKKVEKVEKAKSL